MDKYSIRRRLLLRRLFNCRKGDHFCNTVLGAIIIIIEDHFVLFNTRRSLMGTFIGRIDIRGDFYNFKPLFEIHEDGEILELQEEDYETIIPESERRDINFSYSIYSDDSVSFMENTFYEDVPVVYEFETEDLELNIDRDGKLNQTGYRIRTRDEYEKGKIKPLSAYNLSLVIDEREIDDNPREVSILELGTSKLMDDSSVMIWLKKEDMLTGPYNVNYRKIDQIYVAITKPEEHHYILSGYSLNACEFIDIETRDEVVTYARPNKSAVVKNIDVISEKTLLESFKKSIEKDYLSDGKLDLSNIDELVEAFSNSPFMVNDDTIRRNRLQRIKEKLEISDDVEDSFKFISETLGNEFGSFILKYDDKEASDSLINSIIGADPRILNRVPEYSYARERIEKLLAEEENLKSRVDDLHAQLSGAREVDYDRQMTLAEIQDEIEDLEGARDSIKKELASLESKHGNLVEYDQLEGSVSNLKRENEYLETRKEQLNRETGELSTKLSDVTTNIEKKLAEIPIDGLVANLLTESASNWKRDQEHEEYTRIISGISALEKSQKNPEELVEYMFQRISEVRPLYDKNTITNICTSIFQSFITVFSGDPGCGKTSICNIVGQALGLEKLEKDLGQAAARYIPVSVERGWTSKRDFIGYYNPLTKTFDKNNKKVFNALKIADIEEKEGIEDLPLVILLDEANLSQMEYYWADFMNVCDDIDVFNEINVGEDQILKIPQTLRFVATINNDDTTEKLSPRLIDRASIITLPKVSLKDMSAFNNTGRISADSIELITWDSIYKAFILNSNDVNNLSSTARRIYEEILKPHLKKYQIYISPRTDISVSRYCNVAAKLFEQSSDAARRDPSLIALDYAIAQKILPKINGYGDEYSEWLKELMKKCEDNYLLRSKEIINDILTRGEANMNYYQFFA